MVSRDADGSGISPVARPLPTASRLCRLLGAYAGGEGAIDALVEPYNNAWDIRATEVLIAEAGGECRLRAVVGGKFTAALFGCKAVVQQIADVTGF